MPFDTAAIEAQQQAIKQTENDWMDGKRANQKTMITITTINFV